MESFRNVDKFNEALQDKIKTLRMNVEAKSYEDLKKEPDKYKFYESENYITFILKNREKNSKALKSLIVFRVHTTLEEVTLKSFSIYGPELEFMNKATAEEVWE